MTTIEIDEDLLRELEKRASGFGATPNSVLRRMLGLDQAAGLHPVGDDNPSAVRPGFLGHGAAVRRYVEVFARLYKSHPDRFPDLARFLNRSRIYISCDPNEIKTSGQGVQVKPVPDSPYWLMVTLDNNQKRRVVHETLVFLCYSGREVDEIMALLPESKPRKDLVSQHVAPCADGGPQTP